jgi:hypothetical protein
MNYTMKLKLHAVKQSTRILAAGRHFSVGEAGRRRFMVEGTVCKIC